MRTLIVVPARYASSRLPGKPLLRSTGKYLIQHVVERARQARCADGVLVATDDSRIAAAVASFGGQSIMTSRMHRSGTDRVAEVARRVDADVYVNLQGDEPEIDPADIDRLVDVLSTSPDGCVATLAAPITSIDDYQSPHCVKVTCDPSGRALYFSRSPIPMVRDGEPDLSRRPSPFLQHIGIYGYRREDLLAIAQLPPSPLENLEKLEQLRALEHGWSFAVGVVARASRGVDTFDDYLRFARSVGVPRPRAAAA